MKPHLAIDDSAPRREGYHRERSPGIGFDDNDEPIITVEPTFGDEAESLDSIAAKDRQERMGAFFEWLAHDGNVRLAGARGLLLAHVNGRGVFKTDAELARKLNISKSRISQMRKEINDFLPGVNGNRRQKLNHKP